MVGIMRVFSSKTTTVWSRGASQVAAHICNTPNLNR